jgi:hypothetical protein
MTPAMLELQNYKMRPKSPLQYMAPISRTDLNYKWNMNNLGDNRVQDISVPDLSLNTVISDGAAKCNYYPKTKGATTN